MILSQDIHSELILMLKILFSLSLFSPIARNYSQTRSHHVQLTCKEWRLLVTNKTDVCTITKHNAQLLVRIGYPLFSPCESVRDTAVPKLYSDLVLKFQPPYYVKIFGQWWKIMITFTEMFPFHEKKWNLLITTFSQQHCAPMTGSFEAQDYHIDPQIAI